MRLTLFFEGEDAGDDPTEIEAGAQHAFIGIEADVASIAADEGR
jgi:hypothetical protein